MNDEVITHERLLVVDAQPNHLVNSLKTWLSRYEINIYIARSGIEALEKYRLYSPGLILMNSELPDMYGMSVSSIIKDGEDGSQTTVILYNLQDVFQNTKADFFFNKMSQENFDDMLQAQLKTFYNEKFVRVMHSMELQMAQHRQYQMLPQNISDEKYNVINIFSAYSAGLSGDCYDYWKDKDGNLFGILFDCTGHDINAYSQVHSLRMSLKKDMKLYEMGYDFCSSLSDVLKSVNEDLFIDSSPEMTAAIVFKLDIAKKKFFYCTAGMPGIIVRKNDKWEKIEDQNYLLGCSEQADFAGSELDITKEVKEIICCSDGFYELVMNNDEVVDSKIAKHDDVSAVIVQPKIL